MVGKSTTHTLNREPYNGYTDQELVTLVNIDDTNNSNVNLKTLKPIWLYWTVEVNGFGKGYRKWLGIPKFFPLPLYGDHGIHFTTTFAPHEYESKPKVHVVWSKHREESLRLNKRKNIIRITHPWVTYRREKGITKRQNAKGTLVFLPHSVPGIKNGEYNWVSYFEKLIALPDIYKPLVLCVHMHDINNREFKFFRQFNLPIVTAGNTSSYYFIDRFYDLISYFKFATSFHGEIHVGSQLFYCYELGLEYFMFGDVISKYNITNKQEPLGERIAKGKTKQLVERCVSAFSVIPPQRTPEKENIITDILGLDVNQKSAKLKLKTALAIEFFRHFPLIIWILIKTVLIYTKYTLLSMKKISFQ